MRYRPANPGSRCRTPGSGRAGCLYAGWRPASVSRLQVDDHLTRVSAEIPVDNSIDACVMIADQYLVGSRLDAGLLDDRCADAEIASQALDDDLATGLHAAPGAVAGQ